ncbi:RNA ligase family protein [Halopenitus salinus]|uniref:RNA ligase family protein n=1 Tax=Halopenitus salinus TaxID=1198295 RepID=A0ABD5UQ71_9EURY
MKEYPSIPRAEDAPDRLLEGGHLWLLEKIDGGHLRMQLRESGLIRFGDRNRVYEDAEEIPVEYRHAVRHVRENLDREALRAAVDDVEDVVLFGEATYRNAIDYEWDRIPPFLGFDVWSDEAGAFRPPDAVESIFEALGLDPVNAIEREVRARDFDPGSYAIPKSEWYDGPAAGVVIRNKSGDRAAMVHPKLEAIDASEASEGSETTGTSNAAGEAETTGETETSGESTPSRGSSDGSPEERPDEVIGRYVSDDRLERTATRIAERGEPVTVEALTERVLERVLRETTLHREGHGGRGTDGRSSGGAGRADAISCEELRDTVTERAVRFLG